MTFLTLEDRIFLLERLGAKYSGKIEALEAEVQELKKHPENINSDYVEQTESSYP